MLLFIQIHLSHVTISINSSSNATVSTYNFYGQLVQQSTHNVQAGNTATYLDLPNLNKGFYFLKTVINGKVKTSSTW
jgi:hypothetical protein